MADSHITREILRAVALDVHREALAALLLFQDAARRDELTVAAVTDLATYLKAARTDPTLRYRDL